METEPTEDNTQMLFDQKLQREIYTPWKDYYINYIKLKKLLKEGVILKNSWTEADEQNFVSALDLDLEKVYKFQHNKFDELNEILNDLQATTESTTDQFDVQSFTSQLESVLNLTQELNHFQRLNYTGFTKIVKKHDRLHTGYSVKPLLNVRLKSLPFHSEDYSPLLFKVSALFQFLRDNYVVDQALSKLSSLNDDSAAEEYKSFKFWVHADNLMEVKASVLRKLPVLVYNNGSNYDDDDDDDDEEEEGNMFSLLSKNDPIINCLYFDNEHFDLYNNKLNKTANASTLRLKWVGPLYKKPEISIEKKTFEKQSETYDLDEKFSIKEKYLDSFVTGKFEEEKYLKKMTRKGKSSAKIDDARKHIQSFSKYIKDNNVQPCLRTVYKRTAFQIPGDDKVRVVIDSDICFIREDSFDSQRPIRDPVKWHRTDIDSKVSNPFGLLRKGEFVKFPYAELEIKVKMNKRGKKMAWVEDLMNSHLVKEIPHFSKFIHGIASLFLEDDKLENIPFWFTELESDLMGGDFQQNMVATKEKMAKLQSDEENLLKFKSMLANSSNPGYGPRSKSFSNNDLVLDPNITPGALKTLDTVAEVPSEDPTAISGVDYDQTSDDFEDEDETPQPSFLSRTLGLNAVSKLMDIDSEDEEIVLPAGVSKPESYIKNAGPLRIEPKVWMANERTFNRWLHVTTLLSTLTFVVYSATSKANSEILATWLAYLYFGLTLFSGVWGYFIFMRRREIIMERSDSHLDNVVGPLIVAGGLMFALIINFVYGFRNAAKSVNVVSALESGSTADYFARNPVQKSVLDVVFKIVGA